MGKRMAMNQRSRKMIADYCERHNINSCENCGGTFGLAPAHKFNRIEYHTAEELADPKNWVALDIKCHMEIEGNNEKTEELFRRLRP
jgi:hypothetical protein